jgi:dihydrofolate synthase / folylpolyglutamate synthase
MLFTNETDAVTYIFTSLASSNWQQRGLDENTRDTVPAERLINMHGLLDSRREYAVVTGSKGKGSVTAITANLLKHLGHTVGTITSPHLVSYRERIRVNGKAIPEADFLRIVNWLAPAIESIKEKLPDGKYLSPQGIFLAMALRWFDEQEVTAAVIEVGRGGRFDDNALVPNQLSMFTPIVLEHARYLGPTLERIAWHKAGIIKPQSYAYSLPQAPEVMEMLRREAEFQDAEFEWIAPADMGEYLGPAENGVRMALGRYGEVTFPFYGLYEIDNATLAVWGAGNMHARLPGIPHGSPEYVERIRRGLETVIWPGRLHKLQDSPAVYIDGAINPLSVQLMLNSLSDKLTPPVVAVTAVPTDRDYRTVYGQLIEVCDALIITQTSRNITITFPDQATALSTAREVAAEQGRDIPIHYASDIPAAVDAAVKTAGKDGTVVMAVAQPAIGDAFVDYGLFYEQI